MDFVSTRVITDDIKRLVRFYAHVTGLSPTWYTEDFAELVTPSCTLAIGSRRTMDLFGRALPAPPTTAPRSSNFVLATSMRSIGNWRRSSTTSSRSRQPSLGETAPYCSATRTGI
jgi:hypothetical protein